jgi:hypothetical protein
MLLWDENPTMLMREGTGWCVDPKERWCLNSATKQWKCTSIRFSVLLWESLRSSFRKRGSAVGWEGSKHFLSHSQPTKQDRVFSGSSPLEEEWNSPRGLASQLGSFWLLFFLPCCMPCEVPTATSLRFPPYLSPAHGDNSLLDSIRSLDKSASSRRGFSVHHKC